MFTDYYLRTFLNVLPFESFEETEIKVWLIAWFWLSIVLFIMSFYSIFLWLKMLLRLCKNWFYNLFKLLLWVFTSLFARKSFLLICLDEFCILLYLGWSIIWDPLKSSAKSSLGIDYIAWFFKLINFSS